MSQAGSGKNGTDGRGRLKASPPPDAVVPPSGGWLRPFPKGKSGNPGGRTPLQAEVQRLAREQGPASIRKLVDLRDNSKDERVQAICAKELLERGFGRPKEMALEKPRTTLDTSKLSTAEIKMLLDIFGRAAVQVRDDGEPPAALDAIAAAETEDSA